jgi:hypothetical protein
VRVSLGRSIYSRQLPGDRRAVTTPLKDSLIYSGLNQPATLDAAGTGLADPKPKTTDGPATAKTRAGTSFKDTTRTPNRRVTHRARSTHVARHGYPSPGLSQSPRRRSAETRAPTQRPGPGLGPEADRDPRLPGDVLGRPPNPPPRQGDQSADNHPEDIAVSRTVQEARTPRATATPPSQPRTGFTANGCIIDGPASRGVQKARTPRAAFPKCSRRAYSKDQGPPAASILCAASTRRASPRRFSPRTPLLGTPLALR